MSIFGVLAIVLCVKCSYLELLDPLDVNLLPTPMLAFILWSLLNVSSFVDCLYEVVEYYDAAGLQLCDRPFD